MKAVILVVGVLLVVMLFSLFGQSNTQSADTSLADIKAAMAEGAALVDVRTETEYNQEHAVGAINVPLQQMQTNDFGSLTKDQVVYVYCRTGNRSAQAVALLQEEGYKNVVNIQSLDAWKKLGGETVSR